MENSAAFDWLYREHKSSLYKLACYLTRNEKEAEDLFQETWLRIVRHLAHKTIDMDNCKTWMMTITSNLYRDWLRKKRVRRAFALRGKQNESPADTHFEQPTWGEHPSKKNDSEHLEVKMAISKALVGLPSKQRLIFVLKEIEGFKYAEISEMLDLPEGTVKSIMHRAVRNLRRDLWAFNPKKTIIASV